MQESEVVYCAYTGKATLVLSNKGCKNTSTLHKLLYHARLNQLTGTFRFYPRSSLEHSYRIVVVDEISMMPRDMWNLLIQHPVYILALGDPGQLGPVKDTGDTGLLQTPHIFLNEIMRQAEGNEIIKLSMKIRQGERLVPFKGDHVQIIQKNELTTGMMEWADQILCAKNNTRHILNSEMRKLKGHGEDPEIGDKIICLKNYWDIVGDSKSPLVNGTIGYITDIEKYYHARFEKDMLRISFITELEETFSDINVDYRLITENQPSFTKAEYAKFSRNLGLRTAFPKEFAYGYAITTWKAQGSEWDKILLIEEDFPYDTDNHKRYLYTGITRASEKLVVIKK